MALLLLSLLFFFQDNSEKAPDKAPDKCSLSGTVVDSVSGEPLNKVSLWLLPLAGDATIAATVSDGKGEFALAGLDPGSYRLRGNRSGYLEMPYGARSPTSNGTILTLDPGQALGDLKFKLIPGGAVTGTIRDSDGEPMESAHVQLGQIEYSDRGQPHLETRSTYSDDRGEYRFHGMSPGKYYISAVENPRSVWGQVDRSAGKGPAEVSVVTFYPGASDSSTASRVEVLAGKRLTGIDITLLRVPAVCISGRVTMPLRSSRMIIELEAAGAAMGKYSATTSPKSAAGDFQFCRVPSGSYLLSAYADRLSVRVPVNVGSVDVTDIRLTLAPGADIEGRVVVEGQEKPSLANFQVEFELDGSNVLSANVDASKGGAFMINDRRPDHYEVRTSTPPRGFYVKIIRSGETDVLADGLTISGPGTVPLEVMLSSDGSGLSGVVLDKDEQPVVDATVLVAPDQRSHLDLFGHTTTDQRGRYEFSALAPGKYKLFAWDEVKPYAWNDPDFLKDYESQAEKAALDPKTTVNLHLAVPPDAK